jgi:hypothetical protein
VSLPEIPGAAVLAAARTVFGELVNFPGVVAGLTAAWPHLYAAALRHAAAELDRDCCDRINDVAISDEADSHPNTPRWMSLREIATLHRLADEADPQP